MAGDSNIDERSIRNEEKISNIKESLNELKVDFQRYKENVESNRKHQENMFFIKLGLVVAVISTIMTLIVSYFLKN